MKPVLTLILVLLPPFMIVLWSYLGSGPAWISRLLPFSMPMEDFFFFSGLSQYGSEVLLLSKKIDFALDVGSWMMELK